MLGRAYDIRRGFFQVPRVETPTHLAGRSVGRNKYRFVAFDVVDGLLLERIQGERILLRSFGGRSIGRVRLPVGGVHRVLKTRMGNKGDRRGFQVGTTSVEQPRADRRRQMQIRNVTQSRARWLVYQCRSVYTHDSDVMNRSHRHRR